MYCAPALFRGNGVLWSSLTTASPSNAHLKAFGEEPKFSRNL